MSSDSAWDYISLPPFSAQGYSGSTVGLDGKLYKSVDGKWVDTEEVSEESIKKMLDQFLSRNADDKIDLLMPSATELWSHVHNRDVLKEDYHEAYGVFLILSIMRRHWKGPSEYFGIPIGPVTIDFRRMVKILDQALTNSQKDVPKKLSSARSLEDIFSLVDAKENWLDILWSIQYTNQKLNAFLMDLENDAILDSIKVGINMYLLYHNKILKIDDLC
jgi:hypothetical protein